MEKIHYNLAPKTILKAIAWYAAVLPKQGKSLALQLG